MAAKSRGRIKPATIVYFIQETGKSLVRNGVMTIASTLTMAVTTFILGCFLLLFFNSSHIAGYLEDTVQISVYMENDATEDEINVTGAELAALPGVKEVKTVTKQEALSRFRVRLGENAGILDGLKDNPLPYSFEVRVDIPERIIEITPIIQKMAKVESVQYARDVVERLFKFTKVLRNGGLILVLLTLCGTLFIIINTIRLTVINRSREVEIMKCVGATNWFIRWPFMLEGIVIGLAGTLTSALVLSVLYSSVHGTLQLALAFLPILSPGKVMAFMWPILLIFGGGIGALGSYISLKKFLLM